MRIEGKIDTFTLLRKLREGTDFFRLVKRVSPNGLQVSVAASVLAGLLFAVKDGKIGNFVTFGQQWLSDGFATSDKSWLVPGLQNLGNNCFLNVILQALSSCLSFRRYLQMIFEEYGFSSIEESAAKLPLASALASILELLCMAQQERSVVSPRQLMFGLGLYMPNFDLTSQQDAEEALFHLLSSLREELWVCYIPSHSSLADVTAESNFRILTPTLGVKESELQRWKYFLLGPFDGILGSILSCQSCSFQISLEFQLFHSLHLSPPVSSGGIIIPGCSVEDCLKRFFVSERLENYFCNHCWHVGAMKYLSLMGEHETDVELLQRCNKDDSCHCKNLSSLRALPWSNTFSRSFKQLSLTRSPQILCIYLQRASVDIFGELVKIQGHITFPLILDLSPFMDSGGVGVKNLDESAQTRQQQQLCSHQHAAFTFANNNAHEIIKSRPIFSGNPGSKEDGPFRASSSREHIYRLVSVVEHFGTVGSGHYTVYRRVGVQVEGTEDDPTTTQAMWFSISDSEVSQVSDTDVLHAEPTLLFYEKMFSSPTAAV